MQFLRRPVFSFVHEAEQISLYFGSRHILEGTQAKSFFEVAFAHALVGTFLDEPFSVQQMRPALF